MSGFPMLRRLGMGAPGTGAASGGGGVSNARITQDTNIRTTLDGNTRTVIVEA